jgi:DeoR family transcriptional regulator, fructose operon transcriptional repressor
MNSKERQEQILKIIDQKSRVSINELVELFSVNAMTVRRDLEWLERRGLLRRHHGGASSNLGRSYEPPFLVRSDEHKHEKELIGIKAAGLIKDGDSVAIDVGTTALEVAKNLKGKTNLTIITLSLVVVQEIITLPDIRIFVLGGLVNKSEPSLTGELALSAIENFFIDKYFLGVGGVDFSSGLSEYNFEDAQLKKVLIRNAKEVILVADSSKFNRTTFAHVAPLKVVHRIVTDDSLDSASRKEIKKRNIGLLIANP